MRPVEGDEVRVIGGPDEYQGTYGTVVERNSGVDAFLVEFWDGSAEWLLEDDVVVVWDFG